MSVVKIKKLLRQEASLTKATVLQKFFKTEKGRYGEGDKFLGVVMPQQRFIAGRFVHLEIKEILKLLHSPWHEERMTALLIWVYKFQKSTDKEKEKIFQAYLENTNFINNWDLVDATCRDIVGGYLQNKDRKILYTLADSTSLWERRISLVATFYFLSRQKDCADTLRLAEKLLGDKHDLIHKACGWALRETGKICGQKVLEKFLRLHGAKMARVTLRYAIERMNEKKRKAFLKIRQEK